MAAAADAPEGKQTITITATPKTGKAVTSKFEVNVKKGEAKPEVKPEPKPEPKPEKRQGISHG